MKMKRIISYGLTGLTCYYIAGNLYLTAVDKEMDEILSKNINDSVFKQYLSYPLLRCFPLLLNRRLELLTKENLSNAFIALVNNEPRRKYFDDAYEYFPSPGKHMRLRIDIYCEMRRLMSEDNKYIFDYIIHDSYADHIGLYYYIIKHDMKIDNVKKAALYLNLVEKILDSNNSRLDDLKYRALLDNVRGFKRDEVEKI